MRHIFAIMMIALLCGGVILLFSGIQNVPVISASADSQAQTPTTEGIELSHREHFYEESIQVSIKGDSPDTEFHYTLDGSEPTIASQKYTKPIHMVAEKEVKAHVLRVLRINNGSESNEGNPEKDDVSITHTYFLGEGVKERFSTLVISLSINPEYLYDHETGIFVEGRLREEFILNNPDQEIFHYHPANYNLRGRLHERQVHVEMFEADGERVIQQLAGMRTHGGWARSLEQKSIRLIARNEYEEGKGSFEYDFFENDVKFDDFDSPVLGYDTLVLRNAANYMGEPMVNHQVSSVLAQKTGFHEVLFFRPAAVFLNGEYYGFLYVEQLINEKSLQESYKAPEPAFEIVGTGETEVEETLPETLEDIALLNSYASKDLTDEKVYQELCQWMDVDNFLHYYAMEAYLGNSDWPQNNLKRWRYTGDATVENLHPHLDGRWRHILYDLDRTFGFMPDDRPTLIRLMGESEESSPMLKALLKRPELAQEFLGLLSELANGSFSPETVDAAWADIRQEAIREIQIAHQAGKFSAILPVENPLWSFSKDRWKALLPEIKGILGYSDTFEVIVEGIRQRTIPADSVASMIPVLSRYESFQGWMVNGKPHAGEKLEINAKDAKDGVVRITQKTSITLPSLQIVQASERKNRLVLRNNTNTTIRTRGMYLTDDASDLKRWKFIPMRIKGGQTFILVGSRITKDTVLFTPQINFNIQAGEVLILSDEQGTVLDYHIVQ